LYPMIASMESLNAGSHKVVRRGTHLPDAQAAVASGRLSVSAPEVTR